MTIYLFPTGENLYTVKGREQGHRHVILTRAGLKSVKAMARLLRERDIQKVFCSDLQGQSGHAVGRELRVPVVAERGLRHFNVGRLAGKTRDVVEAVIQDLVKKWEDDPTIPITGGDSWISYSHRIENSLRTLVESKLRELVLVLDARTFNTARAIWAQGPGKQGAAASLLSKHSDGKENKVIVVRFRAAS